MTSDWGAPGSSCPTRLSSQPIEAIQHLKVSFDDPETSTDGGLDFERCSALHVTREIDRIALYLTDNAISDETFDGIM